MPLNVSFGRHGFGRKIVDEQCRRNRRVTPHRTIDDIDHDHPHFCGGERRASSYTSGRSDGIRDRSTNAQYSFQAVRHNGQAFKPRWIPKTPSLPGEHPVRNPFERLDEVQQDMGIRSAKGGVEFGSGSLLPGRHRGALGFASV